MRRRTCILALATQAMIASAMGLMRVAYLKGWVGLSFANASFTLLVAPFLALVPFGVFSLILSMGAKLIMTSDGLKSELKIRVENGYPETMLVWEEVLEEIRNSK